MVPDDSVFGDARFAVYRGPPHQWGDFVRVFLRLKSCIKLDTFIYYMTSRLKNTPCSNNEFMNQRGGIASNCVITTFGNNGCLSGQIFIISRKYENHKRFSQTIKLQLHFPAILQISREKIVGLDVNQD